MYMSRRTLTCTWLCMRLDGSTYSECLPERTGGSEPSEHVPRTSGKVQTCVRDPGGLPACHGAESTRKDPRPKAKKNAERLQNICNYSSEASFSICYTQEKKTDRLSVCPDVRLILVLVLGRQIVYGQNTVYLCLSKYIVFENTHTHIATAASEA